MHLPTVARVVEKSFRHPLRAVRNGIGVLRFAMLDHEAERTKLFAFLHDKFHVDTDGLQREFEASEFATWTRERRQALADYPGPYRFGSTGEWDCEALYYLVRSLQPRSVVETGVCYGASSSYILEALARNGQGKLYSIDLGNTADEPPNDFFIHPAHRDRWKLIIGDSKIEMPPLLQNLGQIDLFHHDSLHTYEHMMWEYEKAFAHLNPAGALSSDDVNIILSLSQPFQNSPFTDFCRAHGWDSEKARNFGLAVNGSADAAHLRRQRTRALSERNSSRATGAPLQRQQ
jgi:predicted O-methyltransferase YrrM